MISVDLSYNPYLNEINVLLNGQKPRINSLIEKNNGRKLQEWVKDLPLILYDEMNGYDFDLEFTGTELDFEIIKDAFLKAGVKEDEVRFFHKKELENQNSKLKELEDLFKWLSTNKNRCFDYENFRIENSDRIEKNFSFILINTENNGVFDDIEVAGEKVNIININNIKEIDVSDLKDIPLIVFVNDINSLELRDNIYEILSKDEIDEKQIFFLIASELNRKQIERILMDLGITNPQIISSFEDEVLVKYFEQFLMIDYILAVCKELRIKINELQKDLNEKNKKSKKNNSEIYYQIELIDKKINSIKNTLDIFDNKENLDLNSMFSKNKEKLISYINKWNKLKKYINDLDKAKIIIKEFDDLISKKFNETLEKIDIEVNDKLGEIEKKAEFIYQKAKIDIDFIPKDLKIKDNKNFEYKSIYNELLKVCKEQEKDINQQVVNNFLHKNIPRNCEPKKIKQKIYLYEDLRKRAIEIMRKDMDEIKNENISFIEKYYGEIYDEYKNHLIELKNEKEKEKKSKINKLSDEEKLLQEDSDWIYKFDDILCNIEERFIQ